MKRKWNGSIVAIVTPFKEDKNIDYHTLGNLIEFHIENQSDGMVVCGTTGEAATLLQKEYGELIEFVVKKIDKRIPVIAGVGSNATNKAIENSLLAESLGVDGVLAVSPYYNKPTEKGLKDYFVQIAKAISIPVLMYNVPGRTASNISASLAVSLACEVENIVGIKEASGNLEQMAYILRNKPDDFMVFSGDDALAFPAVCLGANGVISVVANLFPQTFHRLMKLSREGDLKLARKLHFDLLKIIQLCFVESNPIPVKTGLYLMGKIQEEFRSPMTIMQEENKTKFDAELQKLLNLGFV